MRFTTVADLVMTREDAQQPGPLERRQCTGASTSTKLLIIDEIGYLPLGREQANRFFEVVAQALREGGDGKRRSVKVAACPRNHLG